MENPPIWTPTDSDKKATIDMILVRQFPNAKYRFLNNELVWEDSSPQPTDSDLQERMRKFDSDQGLT
tara:strand:+ start:2749 stop:2949 length:201 start_codon:yes stop_codon:yes gene_type:complete